MIRNFKALMMVFAFGAMAMPVASAQGAFSAPEPVTLIGEETGGTDANSWTLLGGKLHCSGSTMTGHKIATTPHGLIPAGATEMTLTPHYKNCVTEDPGGNKFPTTIDMNGCDYKGKIGSTTVGVTGLSYGFDLQIVCPEGKHIQITHFSSSSHALRVCTKTITNTTLTSDAHIGNDTSVAPDDLWLAGTFTNIKVHRSGLCGSATDEAGVMHVDMTLKGFNAVKEQINVTVVDL